MWGRSDLLVPDHHAQGHILLDGALPESAPQIEAHITALGFKLKDVKILLNSHAHFDHSGGLAQLKRDDRRHPDRQRRRPGVAGDRDLPRQRERGGRYPPRR